MAHAVGRCAPEGSGAGSCPDPATAPAANARRRGEDTGFGGTQSAPADEAVPATRQTQNLIRTADFFLAYIIYATTPHRLWG